MKRKVVKHGPATFMISLPSKWVKRYNIKKGEELNVEENDNFVVIATDHGINLEKVEVDVTGLDRSSLMFLIRSLYKIGYDEIDLKFKEQIIKHYRTSSERTVLSVVHEEISRLSGIEIMQQKEDFCVLKTITEMSPQDLDVAIRRSFLLLLDMSEDLLKAADKRDEALLSTLEEKHNTITKFLSLCMRIINKKGCGDKRKTVINYTILTLMDKTLDLLKNTGRLLLSLKPMISAEVLTIMVTIHKSLREFYKFYYEPSNTSIMYISLLRDNCLKEIQENFSKLSKKEIVILTSLIPVIELVSALTENKMALHY